MKIIYFAPIDWSSIQQRPQHLAKILSKKNDFYYIQPLGLRNLRLSDFKRFIGRLYCALPKKINLNESNVKIRNPIIFPFINDFFRIINYRLLKLELGNLIDDQSIIWITAPSIFIFDLLQKQKTKCVIYEMLDDYASMHPNHKKMIDNLEKYFINRANLIIATSLSLFNKAKKINPEKKVALISNGVSYNFFTKKNYQRPKELIGFKKIVGYTGTIDSWLDLAIIEFLAKKRPDLNFIFVGPIKIKQLPKKSNIRFIGEKNYASMPSYINSFDVCLIPFKPGKFADTINPVKLFEYLSLGKPIITSSMKELESFHKVIYLCKNKKDFLSKLNLCFDEKDKYLASERKKIAKNNDWKIKAIAIEKLIR